MNPSEMARKEEAIEADRILHAALDETRSPDTVIGTVVFSVSRDLLREMHDEVPRNLLLDTIMGRVDDLLRNSHG